VTPPDQKDSGKAAGTSWTDQKNARRCELIDKDIQGTISDAERQELESLTQEMRAYRRRLGAIPLDRATRLHKQLLEKKLQREEGRTEQS
jgi:hypothetical protein